MPYLLPTNIRFEYGIYSLKYVDDLVKTFPFLKDKTVIGKIMSISIKGKITRINKDFICDIQKENNSFKVKIREPNPLKEKGLPECDVLVIFYRYIERKRGTEDIELPIMEDRLIKTESYGPFDDEIKRLMKEEEIGIILKSIVFHQIVASLAKHLEEAFLSFEEEKFSSTKTSCRKILEKLKNIVKTWELIDNSKNFYEKFERVLNSLYSFASIGGPHEGVITKEETELILKNTYGILLYVNSILKSDRFKSK